MSTIVVVRKKASVCIGADTLTSFGPRKQPGSYKAEPDKVFRLGESHLGITGSPAHRLVLESIVANQGKSPKFASRQDVFEFFRALHPRLKDEYYLNPKEHDKDPYESSQMDILIANRFGAFGLMALRDAYEYSRFWSIGSGSSYALGAMSAAYELDLTAQQIAEVGLKAAVEFDDATGLPITLHTEKLDAPGTA